MLCSFPAKIINQNKIGTVTKRAQNSNIILSFSSTPSFRLSTAPERYSSMEVLFVFRIRVTKFLFGEVLNENVREDTRQKTRETAKFHSRTPLLHEFSASSRLLSSLQRS